jgi:hypothetical protein
MDNHKEKAALYRKRAEDMSALASTMSDERVKRVLQGVASDYAQMAQVMDSLAKLGGPPKL